MPPAFDEVADWTLDASGYYDIDTSAGGDAFTIDESDGGPFFLLQQQVLLANCFHCRIMAISSPASQLASQPAILTEVLVGIYGIRVGGLDQMDLAGILRSETDGISLRWLETLCTSDLIYPYCFLRLWVLISPRILQPLILVLPLYSNPRLSQYLRPEQWLCSA